MLNSSSAPTTNLCAGLHQQTMDLMIAIPPACQVKCRSGAGVEQGISAWLTADASASMHALLWLTASVVQLAEVNLLIFDEAHHCVRKDPYNCIMQEFYHDSRCKVSAFMHMPGHTCIMDSCKASSLTLAAGST